MRRELYLFGFKDGQAGALPQGGRNAEEGCGRNKTEVDAGLYRQESD
jgi:hypothetical protein